MANKLSRHKIDTPGNLVDEIIRLFQQQPTSMFLIPEIRNAITMLRLSGVTDEMIEIADTVDPGAIKNAVKYNLQMLKNMHQHENTLQRPGLLLQALRSIYYIQTNRSKLKVLCIGPRTEAEFFMFMAEGFAPENLTGLDLMSYSEFVDVGDMHAMPYKSNSFDIVFVGWTLTYSKDLQKVANECIRVAKPGGYVAIGVESPRVRDRSARHSVALDPDLIIIQSTQEILDLFEGHIHAVPFRHDVHRSMQNEIDMVMVIIELK